MKQCDTKVCPSLSRGRILLMKGKLMKTFVETELTAKQPGASSLQWKQRGNKDSWCTSVFPGLSGGHGVVLYEWSEEKLNPIEGPLSKH